MTVTIPDEMQARLNSGATTLCRCWLVTRKDAVRLGFTDHDRDLAFEGTLFRAGSGLNASVLEKTTGLGVDNAQAVGALQDAGLTEADILAGRYDGAAVEHWLVDWRDPSLRTVMFRGTLGEIRRGGGAFAAELRGLSEALNQPVGRAYLKTCDCVLGDARCGVDITNPAFSVVTTLVGSEGGRFLAFGGLDAYAEGWFTGGRVLWSDGGRSVVNRDRGSGGGRVIEIREELREAVAPGTAATLVAGCDRRLETCRDKFANTVNFRGFPQMPGEDWVLATPAGRQNDGGAL